MHSSYKVSSNSLDYSSLKCALNFARVSLKVLEAIIFSTVVYHCSYRVKLGQEKFSFIGFFTF